MGSIYYPVTIRNISIAFIVTSKLFEGSFSFSLQHFFAVLYHNGRTFWFPWALCTNLSLETNAKAYKIYVFKVIWEMDDGNELLPLFCQSFIFRAFCFSFTSMVQDFERYSLGCSLSVQFIFDQLYGEFCLFWLDINQKLRYDYLVLIRQMAWSSLGIPIIRC